MFNDMAKDNISVIKIDGSVIDALKASVQSGSIYLFNSKVLIEPNDIIVRRMSNGGKEQFKVIDPGFNEGAISIEPFYKMKVEKLGIPQKQNTTHIVYNIDSEHVKINNHSLDMSVAIHQKNDEISKKIQEIHSEIEKLSDEIQKREALEILEGIKKQSLAEKPNYTILNVLINSLPSVDNITSISSSLMSLFSK